MTGFHEVLETLDTLRIAFADEDHRAAQIERLGGGRHDLSAQGTMKSLIMVSEPL